MAWACLESQPTLSLSLSLPPMPKVVADAAARPTPYDRPAPGPPSLLELSTAKLWDQSIKQGKADELVRALKGCAEGLKALKAGGLVRKQPVKVIAVNIANSGDGVQEGTAGYMPVTKVPWLDLLLKYEPARLDNDEFRERERHVPVGRDGRGLGGVALNWDDASGAAEWGYDILHKYVSAAEFRSVLTDLKVELDLEGYIDDEGEEEEGEEGEEGEERGHVDALHPIREWLEDAGHDDVTEKLEAAFNDIVESPEQYLLPNAEVKKLMDKHVPLKVVATFSVVEENWQ